jgi:hypothetical protein
MMDSVADHWRNGRGRRDSLLNSLSVDHIRQSVHGTPDDRSNLFYSWRTHLPERLGFYIDLSKGFFQSMKFYCESQGGRGS